MDRSLEEPATPVGRTLEYEMRLVREAIAMVASGASPRVTLGGLRFGEALVAPGRGLATEARVRLVALGTPDHSRAGIAIERITDV